MNNIYSKTIMKEKPYCKKNIYSRIKLPVP